MGVVCIFLTKNVATDFAVRFCAGQMDSRETNCSRAHFGERKMRLFHSQLYVAKEVPYICASVDHTKRTSFSQIKARTLRKSLSVFLAFQCRNLIKGECH